MWFYHRIMCPKETDEMANNVDSDQTWVYTVCPDLCIRNTRILSVALNSTSSCIIERPHDKTNEVAVRPAKTQSAGHVLSLISLCCALNG